LFKDDLYQTASNVKLCLCSLN